MYIKIQNLVIREAGMGTQIEYLSVILRCQDCFNETPIIERGSKLKIASLNPVFRIIVEF
jgi:hypothetical protein